MQKSTTVIGVLSALFFCFSQFASAQTLSHPAVMDNSSRIQIGVAAAVQGHVEVAIADTAVGEILESGKPIYMGDIVRTGPKGRLQIMLLDETVFTIGPESAIVIDEFVYDPRTNDGRLTAQVLEGFFRFVSGKIAKKNPENMNVKLPAGSIGIRGTIVSGHVSGSQSLVALRGPGPSNRVGATVGKIDVSNEVNAKLHTVTVNRPGFGTTIPGDNMPPTPPALVPQEVLAVMDQNLAVSEQESGVTDPNRNATKETSAERDGSQQPKDGANKPVPRDLHADSQSGTGFNPKPRAPHHAFQFNPDDYFIETKDAAQDSSNTNEILDGIALKQQLASIETGKFHWDASGNFVQHKMNGTTLTTGIQGSMNLILNIDFGARTIGGAGSQVGVSTLSNGGNIDHTVAIGLGNFESGGGDLAIYNIFDSVSHTKIEIHNRNGVIGRDATVFTNYDDGSNSGGGAVINAHRQPGSYNDGY